MDSLAAFEIEDLLKITLLLVIVLLAIRIVAAVVGLLGVLLDPLFAISGLVGALAFVLLAMVLLAALRTFGAL